MVDPDTPAPLPPSIVPEVAYLGDGSQVQVVTVLDAARLTGMKPGTIERWIADGKIAICRTPALQKRVLVPSLWNALPVELRR